MFVSTHTHRGRGAADSAANKVVPSSERVSRVLLMLGEEQREVAAMGKGNIAVAVGMKNVSSSSPGYHCSQTQPGYSDVHWRHSGGSGGKDCSGEGERECRHAD